MKIINRILVIILGVFLSIKAFAQVYPVQMNTNFIPPYSLRLSDYVAPGTNRIGLNILLADITEPEYQLRLELTIEGDGITIKTKQSYNPAPIILEGGIPQYFTSSDLAEFFDPQNLDFSGYSKAAYLNTGRLPEGVYRFSFRAYDYNKRVPVSNNAMTTAWLLLNDPPIINLPLPDYKVEYIDPQNIVFQWTPRHTGSPNSAFTTEYEFTLVEIWPEGRNPNDAILTGIPIYQTTTTQTNFVYGLSEPFLEPGRQYAYRIQARDMDERDMFKNNGYSEVRMFTFGEECKPVNNISAKSDRFNEAKISWEPSFTQTEFNVRYRKANDPEAEWFEENTYITDLTITGLEEDTEYEYQVMGYCGTYEGDYSDIQTFKTPFPQVANFECGAEDEENSVSNHDPLPMLEVNDYITVGNFSMKVKTVSGSNGTFSGDGLVLVPYLGFAKISAEFSGVKVNTDYQMWDGEVKTIYNPDSPFILDVTIGDDGSDGNNGGSGDTDGSTDTEFSDTTFNVGIDSVYVVGDDIIIVTEDGTTDTIPNEDDIIIVDDDGDTWVVDGGEVIKGDGTSGSGTGGSTGSGTGNANGSSDNKNGIKVTFERFNGQKYGFDPYKKDLPAGMFSPPFNIDGKDYFASWKSNMSGSFDHVIANVEITDTSYKVQDVKFKTATGIELSTETLEDKNKLKVYLYGQVHKTEDEVIAYITQKDTADNVTEIEVGKLRTISYDKTTYNLKIVPVNMEMSLSDVDEYSKRLKEVYAQAAIDWNIILDNKFEIATTEWDIDGNGLVDDSESGVFANYTKEMNRIIGKYKKERDPDNNYYYLFICNNIKPQSGNLEGYMPFKKQFGLIFTSVTENDMNKITRTAAHEIGHGAFRLYHTFSTKNTYVQSKYTTDNLMDYNAGTHLHKYQWDFIHDPQAMIVWLMDDEEAASIGDDICFTMENLINNFEDWFSNNSDLAMFEHVSESFSSYLNQIKENSENIELEAYSGWSIRDAAYKESANSYLAEKIYDNILNDKSSSLHAKGIYLGEYEIEGNKYNTAVFSYKDEVNIKKFHTKELCELANSKKIKVAIKDGYTLITFFDHREDIEMVLQVNSDELKAAKTWLTYLGIFTEKTTQEEIEQEYNRIVEFWKNLFSDGILDDGTIIGDPIPNPVVTNTSNNEYKGYHGCVRYTGTCRDEYTNNSMSYTNRYKTHDGIDFTVDVGTAVHAIKGGTVYYVDTTYARMNPDFENDNGINSEGEPDDNANCGCDYGSGYGNQIKIECELDVPVKTIDGNEITKVYMRYGHLDTVYVRNGDVLEAGDIIGLSGCSGNAATYTVVEKQNYHVHIEADNESNIAGARMVNVLDLISTKIEQPEP